MKFAELMTFWEMKGMVKQRVRLSQTDVRHTNATHCVCSCQVRNKFEHAVVIYRHNIKNGIACGFALIYADIVFTGSDYQFTDNTPDEIFIKNASVTQLTRHFAENLL